MKKFLKNNSKFKKIIIIGFNHKKNNVNNIKKLLIASIN